jgi:uncharacterized protein
LLIFGLIHAYFIWSGDVLFLYAIMGLFLYPLRKLSVRWMAGLSFIFILLSLAVYINIYRTDLKLSNEIAEINAFSKSGLALTESQGAKLEKWKESVNMFAPDEQSLQEQVETIREGNYMEIRKTEREFVRFMHTELLYPRAFLTIITMMIIGMALMKAEVLSAQLSFRTYFLMMLVGYALGFALVFFRTQYLLRHDFDWLAQDVGYIIYIPERISLALGHIGLLCLISRSRVLHLLKVSLAAVGRMAFSNYIMHSIICTLLFYGYGFSLYGSLDLSSLMWVVGAIWLLQLIISPLWLRYFRFGPLEWMWRSLTYWKRQPMFVNK